jgi:protein transport protein SEC31
LYDHYFEYVDFLATQGLIKHAVTFLKLTSRGYKGAQGTQLEFTTGREHLLIATGVSKETPATLSRTEASAFATATTALAAPLTVTTSTTTSTSSYPYNLYAAAAYIEVELYAVTISMALWHLYDGYHTRTVEG